MKLIFSYMKKKWPRFAYSIGIKLAGTIMGLLLPLILEHIIDVIVPQEKIGPVFLWGILMLLVAFLTWAVNVYANRVSIGNAKQVSYEIRKDLFERTLTLSGSQFDAFGLPSLTSRMTTDSYNVQSFIQAFQTICVRSPILLLGGIIMTLIMDRALASILCIMLPILVLLIFAVSANGIPLYNKVQKRLDDFVRIMRENITGIRVVKALSKTEFEVGRFRLSNRKMQDAEIKAGTLLAIPGPFMQLCLNAGLAVVIWKGADRVNAGLTLPGVILAFLTYFNMIIMGVMGLNRIFVMLSKAAASADRISEVIGTEEDQPVLSEEEALKPSEDSFIRFENVSFHYDSVLKGGNGASVSAGKGPSYGAESRTGERLPSSFSGGERKNCLENISFSVKKGESLGIIGPIGSGKTTIISLLLRFYDATEGGVFVDGKDVRAWDKDELRKKFGIVMQNDLVFRESVRENIVFGRDIPDEAIERAARDAQAEEYIRSLEGAYDFPVDMKGMNLSGGQRQRLMIARALAGEPQILILDDSSSALDYQTDARLRKALAQRKKEMTTVVVAQRVSSLQNMTNILVLDEGRCAGYGSHEELLKSCPMYREIYESQMGALVS